MAYSHRVILPLSTVVSYAKPTFLFQNNSLHFTNFIWFPLLSVIVFTHSDGRYWQRKIIANASAQCEQALIHMQTFYWLKGDHMEVGVWVENVGCIHLIFILKFNKNLSITNKNKTRLTYTMGLSGQLGKTTSVSAEQPTHSRSDPTNPQDPWYIYQMSVQVLFTLVLMILFIPSVKRQQSSITVKVVQIPYPFERKRNRLMLMRGVNGPILVGFAF